MATTTLGAAFPVLVEMTIAELNTIVTAGTGLTAGSKLKITDFCDLGMFIEATGPGTVSMSGTGGFLNPDHQAVGIYTGAPIAFTIQKGIWTPTLDGTLNDGDVVIWEGLHWQCTDQAFCNGVDNPQSNANAFTPMPKSTANSGYIEVWDAIEFDVLRNWIQRRADAFGNDYSASWDSLTSHAFVHTPLVSFQWGSDRVRDNKVVNGSVNILNFCGYYWTNDHRAGSQVYELVGDASTRVTGNILDTDAILRIVTMGGNTTIENNVVGSIAQISDIDMSAGFCSIIGCTLAPRAAYTDKTFTVATQFINNTIGNGVSVSSTDLQSGASQKRTEQGFSNFEATIDIGIPMILTYDTLVNGPFTVGEVVTADNLATGTITSDDGVGLMTIDRDPGIDWYASASITGGTSTATANILTAFAGLTVPNTASHCGILTLSSANPAENISSVMQASLVFDYELHPAAGLMLTLTGTPYATALANSITLPAATLVLDGDTGDFATFRNDSLRNNHVDTVQNT
jgi:hypothetical protein